MVDLPAPGMPRLPILVGLEPSLQAQWSRLSAGRSIVLDYFASRRCSVVIGALTADFRREPPGRGYVELASIDGVPVFAEARLVPVLEQAAPTLRLRGPIFARHLAVSLDPPSRWIDFLEEPFALAGKRGVRLKL
jgi:hypothetical protein